MWNVYILLRFDDAECFRLIDSFSSQSQAMRVRNKFLAENPNLRFVLRKQAHGKGL